MRDNVMKTQYRIIEKHYETVGKRYTTDKFYIPQFRNVWTLFRWKKIDPIHGQYGTVENAEKAIEVHKGMKAVITEIKRYE